MIRAVEMVLCAPESAVHGLTAWLGGSGMLAWLDRAPVVRWIPTVTFLVHVAEEFPRFPGWATRHFGVTSRPWFVYSHLPLIASLLAISSAPSSSAATWLLVGAQWVLFTNAWFHAATTILFREYSPGLVTASALFPAGTALVLGHFHREGALSPAGFASAIVLGTLVGAGVIASLWLPMDLDWRGRLRRRPGARLKRPPPGKARAAIRARR